jgi:hypothetical protein
MEQVSSEKEPPLKKARPPPLSDRDRESAETAEKLAQLRKQATQAETADVALACRAADTPDGGWDAKSRSVAPSPDVSSPAAGGLAAGVAPAVPMAPAAPPPAESGSAVAPERREEDDHVAKMREQMNIMFEKIRLLEAQKSESEEKLKLALQQQECCSLQCLRKCLSITKHGQTVHDAEVMCSCDTCY